MTTKLYIFVDESGQDTAGRLFIVGLVVVPIAADFVRQLCEDAETRSGKGLRKWSKTSIGRRISYVRELLAQPAMNKSLYYAQFCDTQDYAASTVAAIAATWRMLGAATRVTVLIDGLSRAEARRIGLALRRLGCLATKVRGLDDDADPVMRLADAVCGLVRAHLDGEQEFTEVWEAAQRTGVLTKITIG